MNPIRHIDLFSGIGGFSIAVEAVWPNSEHIFCEIDPYCQALLKKRFERSVIFDDIRKFTADTYWNRLQESRPELKTDGDRQFFKVVTDSANTRTKRMCEGENPTSKIDLLTGGFPCQPFSTAGKRKGTTDDRYLWPEMLRVIQEFEPTWVVAENVRGLLTIESGMVFEQVLTDLEGKGYEVQPLIIPACAINAPHRRDRVWIIAKHTKGKFGDLCGYRSREEAEDSRLGKSNQYEDRKNTSDTQSWESRESSKSQGWENFSGRNWETNWLEVATRFCGVDDGLSARVDGLELSKSRHRIERLKGLGNAIVPQVAIELFKAIMMS
uniref:DNA (cytosine-5-)-methyltransferase n=1 Tax=viral metagenome TaxID=1070528 RepID=A0A6H1ZED5_9ZZZZ